MYVVYSMFDPKTRTSHKPCITHPLPNSTNISQAVYNLSTHQDPGSQLHRASHQPRQRWRGRVFLVQKTPGDTTIIWLGYHIPPGLLTTI